MGERPAPVPGVDPLFTDQDAIEILDYLADEHLLCSGCGKEKALAFADEHEFSWRADAIVCHSCVAKSKVLGKLKSQAGAYAFSEFTGDDRG